MFYKCPLKCTNENIDLGNVFLCFVIVSDLLLSVVCSVPPCLGPGCSRLPQGPLAALQKEESGAGGGRADLSVLVSTTGTVLGEKNANMQGEAHQTGNITTWPRPFWGGETKKGRG